MPFSGNLFNFTKINNTDTMNRTASEHTGQESGYPAPAMRVVELRPENHFLLSNTEPIIDDGQEHGWE